MAVKMVAAISDIVIIAGAGFITGCGFSEKYGERGSAEEGSIDKEYLDELLSKVKNVHQKLSSLPVKNSDEAGNITSLIVSIVTFGALAYGIMRLKESLKTECEKKKAR